MLGLLALSFSPVPRTLYPDVGGVVSAYDGLLRRGTLKWSIPSSLGGTMLALLTYFFWPGSWWWEVIALYMVMVAGLQSLGVAWEWSPTAALGEKAVQAMDKLYGALGFDTVISPRTKEANTDADLLLKRFDLFASREQEALAVKLNTPTRIIQAVSAADASILPIAARAISRYISEDVTSPVSVQPVLVLIGRECTEDLARLADEEHIKMLYLTEDAVREVLNTEDKTALRQLAQRYLRESRSPRRARRAPRRALHRALRHETHPRNRSGPGTPRRGCRRPAPQQVLDGSCGRVQRQHRTGPRGTRGRKGKGEDRPGDPDAGSRE